MMDFALNIAPYTIPIPEPVIPGGMEQLAQIIVPSGRVLAVYWRRSTRQAVCDYDGRWFIQSDQNIMNGVARIIGYEKPIDTLAMDGLFIFETVGHGFAADDDLVKNFRECEWSDYASDRMAFQCRLYVKNTESQPSRNIENVITDNIVRKPFWSKTPVHQVDKNLLDKNRIVATPPVLTRATECCCSGCGKYTKTTEESKSIDMKF